MKRAPLLVAMASYCAACALFGPQLAAHTLLTLGFPSMAARLFDDPAWKGAALYADGRWEEASEAFMKSPSSAYDLGDALARAGRFEEAIDAFDRALAANPGDEDAAFNKALLEAALQSKEDGASGGAVGVAANARASKAGGARARPQSEGRTGGSGDGLVSGRETQAASGATNDGKAAKPGKGDGEAKADNRTSAAGAATSSGGAGRYGDMNALVTELLREREARVRRRLEVGAIHPTPDWLQTLSDDPGAFLKIRILAEKTRRLKAAGGQIPEDD